MKTRMIVAAFGAFAVMATAASANTSPVLHTLEVRHLAASGGPADHARLRDHFTALATQAEADAQRQRALSNGLAGNPNRGWPAKPGAHAARLADRAADTAQITRELARYHGQGAAGSAAAVPAHAARFHGGEGAPAPTATELRDLAAAARTPADHRTLEEYFVTLAERHRAVAEKHVAMAGAFRANAGRRTGSGHAAVHCDRTITSSRSAERDALGRAMMHRELATIG